MDIKHETQKKTEGIKLQKETGTYHEESVAEMKQQGHCGPNYSLMTRDIVKNNVT